MDRTCTQHRKNMVCCAGRRMVCVASISHECAMRTIQDSSEARDAPGLVADLILATTTRVSDEGDPELRRSNGFRRSDEKFCSEPE